MQPDLEKRKAALSAEQRAELVRRLEGSGARAVAGIPRASRSLPLPLSYAQERIWVYEQLAPGSIVHNRPADIRLTGPLDIAALTQAMQQVINRHEILNAAVSIENGSVQLANLQASAVEMPIIDVSRDSDPKARASALALEHAGRPFDLMTGPFFRCRLVRVAEQDHLLLLTFHHIAFDAWSQTILIRELADHYAAFASGPALRCDKPAIQYADYAAWERQSAHAARIDIGRTFWKQELNDLPVLQLPTDYPRGQRSNERASQVEIRLPTHVVTALRNLAREEDSTIFSALLAAFSVLLSRYSAQDDLVIGCPVAQRTHVETEDLIGFFINVLPLRAQLPPGSSFRQMLRQARDTTMNALKHRDVPFQLIVQDVLTERDASVHPLFQAMFVYENFDLGPKSAANIDFVPEAVPAAATLVDLSLELNESEQGIAGCLIYRRELWEPASIERMAGHFLKLLDGIVAEPDRQIRELSLLSDWERNQLLVEWNNTAADYPRDRCIDELFDVQVERAPDAVALISTDRQLTYREVNTLANRLAHFLRSKGAGPEVRVGICMKRSPEMVASILGVFKAGAAYVPLDPNYPPQRLEFILRDAAIDIVVTSDDRIERLPDCVREVVCLNSPELAAQSGDSPVRLSHAENLAYTIYTSGSTGKPKGVLVTHRNVVNVLTSMIGLLDLQSGQRVMGFASPTFDISVAEFFLPLLVGGAAIIVRPDVVYDAQQIVDEIGKHRPHIIQATPVTWEMLVQNDGWNGKEMTAISGGEALPPSLAAQLRAKCRMLWDFYGPTETTIWSTAQRVVTPNHSIGRPLQNTKAFVLDTLRQLAPIGVWGELYLGGDGLARGYLNRAELTNERFIANRFDTDPNSRLYRTGDRVRWRADGMLEYDGRLDNQIKLRGFRIELGEIESALHDHPEVAQCAVVLREDRPGDKRLVAYWVPRCGGHVLDLREFLSSRLPGYMVPSSFVRLESLPTTSSGKVDRKSLPPPERECVDLEAGVVAPRTAIEKSLAQIWSEVLGTNQFGVHDNFFHLGGHSLLAVAVCMEIEKRHHRRVPLVMFFGAPNIDSLARWIADEQTAHGVITIVPLQTSGKRAPLLLMPSITGLPLTRNNLLDGIELDRPVFAIGLTEVSPPWHEQARLSEIAGYFAEALSAAKMEQPPHLLGYSFGGMLAYEVARQLHESNVAVGTLLLIDTGAAQLQGISRWRTVRNLPRLLANVPPWIMNFAFNTTMSQKIYEVRRKLRAWRRRIAATIAGHPTPRHLEDAIDTRRVPEIFRKYMETNYRAFKSYLPRPYAGRLVLFRAKLRPLIRGFAPDLNWGQFVSGSIEVVQVPGNHGNILESPNVEKLASQIKIVLDADD